MDGDGRDCQRAEDSGCTVVSLKMNKIKGLVLDFILAADSSGEA